VGESGDGQSGHDIDPLGRYSLRPEEGKRVADARRAGRPFFAYREGGGEFAIFVPEPGPQSLFLGRGDGMDLQLSGDPLVSRVHAELRPAGREWLIKNISKNGTFINGHWAEDDRRLGDGDLVRVGETVLAFVAPASEPDGETDLARDQPTIADLTDTQRRILVALCRPLLAGGGTGAAASNKAIMAEAFVGLETVKDQLGRLYAKYGFGELEQNQKRANLANFAVRYGLVTTKDL
jgi:pSer/pThr/pTyr-binding forkhead associated (FHA) protein